MDLSSFNENTMSKVHVVTYSVLTIFSLFIIIGVAEMKDEFDICPLYFDGPSDRGSDSNCNFPMAIAIMFQLLYTLCRIVPLLLLIIGKLSSDLILFSDILQLVYLCIDIICGFFFTFIGACILSAGYNETCDNVIVKIYGYCSKIESAAQAAQAGAWISTIIWLFISIVGFLFLWRTGKIPFLGGSQASQGQTGTTAGTQPSESPSTLETTSNDPYSTITRY